MKAILLSTLAVTCVAFAANAEPVKLTKDQMATVTAGKITATKVNKGGNTPSGQAHGVPTVNLNPQGKAPAGQNK